MWLIFNDPNWLSSSRPLTDVENWGVYHKSSKAISVSGCTIANNDNGIYSSGAEIDATWVDWGDDTGPYHATLNPDGLGNRVSDNVLFEPWIGDADGDLISNEIEYESGCLDMYDADTDDDGILDGDEDTNQNGVVDDWETNPCDPDTDGDGLQDGTELGYTLSDIGEDTDTTVFIADLDPTTTTDPTDDDSDNDGYYDGDEDIDHNGRVDEDEGDPNAGSSVPYNTAPTTPSLNSPTNKSEVASQTPNLSINNASDENEQQSVVYTFEVYADSSLSELTASEANVSEGSGTTTWQVPAENSLTDHTNYYWRCRASDGYDYSDWMETARFFVNTANEAPSVPVVSSPPDESSVVTLTPTLQVTNSTDLDLDALTYDYEVYADEEMAGLVTSKTGKLEGSGTTSWQVDTTLSDNSWYWWRARAQDDEGEAGGWTELNAFFVDTTNEAPTGLSLSSPLDGSTVTVATPDLAVNNATDPEGQVVTYEFQLDASSAFNSDEDYQSATLEEGSSGMTTWQPADLTENNGYYWRVRATDGAVYSDWVTGSFFVNAVNDAPGAPGISSPGDASQVITTSPTLVVTEAIDPDPDDSLTYTFEVYADESLETPVASADGIEARSWLVASPLDNHATYYWRVSATDQDGLQGAWSQTASFTVNIKPSAPTINSPASGSVVTNDQPTLSVLNGTIDNDAELTYRFELYADQDLTDQISVEEAATEGETTTSWQVPVTLDDGASYYWRVRTSDGTSDSAWTATAMFLVALEDYTLNKKVVSYADVSASATETQVVSVTDSSSSLVGTYVEIESGALSDDATITISEVSNPPSLSEDLISSGIVVDFGPDGLQFNSAVKIAIPYTQELLDTAGLTDPSDLTVWTYNATDAAWEKLTVDSVDTVNQRIFFSTKHFSLYTMAAVVTPVEPYPDPDPEPEPASDGDSGGGGCFLNILAIHFHGWGLLVMMVGFAALFGVAIRKR